MGRQMVGLSLLAFGPIQVVQGRPVCSCGGHTPASPLLPSWPSLQPLPQAPALPLPLPAPEEQCEPSQRPCRMTKPGTLHAAPPGVLRCHSFPIAMGSEFWPQSLPSEWACCGPARSGLPQVPVLGGCQVVTPEIVPTVS